MLNLPKIVERYKWIRQLVGLLAGWLVVSNAMSSEVVSTSIDLKISQQVSRWIEQLDSNKRADRRSARESFLNAGPAILPHLPAPELLPSDAVKDAIRQIRKKLEHSKAKQDVAGSTVNLQGKLTLNQIIKSITSQTKNKIDSSRINPSTLEKQKIIDFKKLPFRKAIDQLEILFPIKAETELLNQQLVFKSAASSGKPSTRIANYVGPFRVTIHSAQLRQLVGDEINQLLRVTFQVVVEPRLRPLFMKLHHKEVIARSNQLLLKHYNPDARIEIALGEEGKSLHFTVDYIVPQKRTIKNISLSGSVTLLMAAGQENIIFSDLSHSKGVSRRRGGVTVRINNFEIPDFKKSRSAKIDVAVSYDSGGPAFESHRTWIFHNLTYLLDTNGKRISRNALFGTALQKNGAVAVEYAFNSLIEPISKYKFVYVAPTLLIDVPLKFSFSNVVVSQQKP